MTPGTSRQYSPISWTASSQCPSRETIGGFLGHCGRSRAASSSQWPDVRKFHTEPGTLTYRPVATFSIVAFDKNTGELGIAVQSRVVSVGAVVPWARAGVGAVATQSFANTSYGPDGLALLEEGKTPEAVVGALTEADRSKAVRQVGVVDAKGRSATFTGEGCKSYAGGRSGDGYAIQGNILASEKVVIAMENAYKKATGELGSRLIAALRAGQAAGGDARGKQSAALLVVREEGGYGGFNDRYRDIRVDDHLNPIEELDRVYQLHKKMFPLREK